MSEKAILAVSFGTSHADTREKTIDRIEEDIRNAYPDYTLYRAWTSKMILKKLMNRDGIKIFNVKEAMEQMIADGVKTLIVQPTHVINGIENDLMQEDVKEYADSFEKITFGNPLLTTEEDNSRVIEAVAEELHPDERDALVLMGHGTTHYANSIYAALDYRFKDMGYKNIFLGTVEAYPSLVSLMKQVHAYRPRKVILAPFMIVAGDHAKNDLSSEDEESWRSQFEKEGFDVECVLKGLGEYPAVRRLFLEHIEAAKA
ncbi:MAG: sirohydrochlorin cobaltochelatase [Candidatus Limivivens sp.]|nr:sirohydrochlorin cobaltochelatase [Candidatus Limivivens sp.]